METSELSGEKKKIFTPNLPYWSCQECSASGQKKDLVWNEEGTKRVCPFCRGKVRIVGFEKKY